MILLNCNSTIPPLYNYVSETSVPLHGSVYVLVLNEIELWCSSTLLTTVDTLRLQPDSLWANLRSPLENKIRGQPSVSGGSSRLRLLMAGGSS